MIQLDSLVLVFMVEAIAGLALLVLVHWIFSYRKKLTERGAAIVLIDKLNQNEQSRNQTLTGILNEADETAPGSLQELVMEISQGERDLYQRIIKMFISRDSKLLTEIDHNIRALTEPYCKFIAEVANLQKVDSSLNDEIESANAEIDRLKAQYDRSCEQLRMALETMDQVSSEYTKIFGGSKSAEDLEESRLKMLNIYKDAEQEFKQTFQNEIFPPLDDDILHGI